jgi:hypothetical protein
MLSFKFVVNLPNFTTNKGKAPIQGGTGTTKGEDLSPKLRMLEIRCGKTRDASNWRSSSILILV